MSLLRGNTCDCTETQCLQGIMATQPANVEPQFTEAGVTIAVYIIAWGQVRDEWHVAPRITVIHCTYPQAAGQSACMECDQMVVARV